MTKVLVTGGFGNIGTKITEQLVARGFYVRCLDLDNKANRKVSRAFRQKVDIVWGDITNGACVRGAVTGVDAVIHTAAILPPMSEDYPSLSHRVNVVGTRNIVDAINNSNTRVQLVLSSSVSVHGNQGPEERPLRKVEDAFKPCDLYSQQKVECEKLLHDSNIDWTICRIGACADEKARLFDTRYQKSSVEVFFNVHPLCRIEYVHPVDVATAMVNAVGNKKAIGKTFFLGGGKRCQGYWREFNAIRLQMLGMGVPPIECFGDGDFYTDWLDTEEGQQILNYQNHDLGDYRQELKALMKWPKRILLPVMPLARWYLWNRSPYLKAPIEHGMRNSVM